MQGSANSNLVPFSARGRYERRMHRKHPHRFATATFENGGVPWEPEPSLHDCVERRDLPVEAESMDPVEAEAVRWWHEGVVDPNEVRNIDHAGFEAGREGGPSRWDLLWEQDIGGIDPSYDSW